MKARLGFSVAAHLEPDILNLRHGVDEDGLPLDAEALASLDLGLRMLLQVA